MFLSGHWADDCKRDPWCRYPLDLYFMKFSRWSAWHRNVSNRLICSKLQFYFSHNRAADWGFSILSTSAPGFLENGKYDVILCIKYHHGRKIMPLVQNLVWIYKLWFRKFFKYLCIGARLSILRTIKIPGTLIIRIYSCSAVSPERFGEQWRLVAWEEE